ncbi:DUF6351 family protein [Paraburkholderia sp. 32]|uniref:DUF6351 family protein n=1 Tax=Paraburkholderia sp. 32 TaxID=2991057 RepID=UPI003D1D6568
MELAKGRALKGALGLVLALSLGACGGGSDNSPTGVVTVQTLSSRPDVVSGGDALIQVQLAAGDVNPADLSVTAAGNGLTSSLKPVADGSLVGLVSGFPDGNSDIMVKSKATGLTLGQLVIVNHSINGPNFAGPKDTIFGCETTAWGLAAPTGADCTAPTVVTYQYRSSAGTFKPYPTIGAPPTDLSTTTVNGVKVDYVVRLETGVIDRAVYQIAFLNKPGQAIPTPATSAGYASWNQRLVYSFGGGCGGGHHQGTSNGGVVDDQFLSKGYAVASSSQNVLGVQCNDVRSAEVVSMVKEHFIKEFGPPIFTIGSGGSGGAMSQHLIATNYPGLLDGLLPSLSFPDTLTEVNMTLDCSVLQHYFASSALTWTDTQKQAVAGFATWGACSGIAGAAAGGVGGLAQIMVNPILGCDASVPSKYDPSTNPSGARCTYQDNLINVFGTDPATGFARRPFDDVGVQYGLAALKSGSISADQFIELNQKVGGYDINGNMVAARTVGDPAAVSVAYTSGRVTDGVQLGSIPIIDHRPYADLVPVLAGVHDILRSYVMRARLIRANGDANNQVILVYGSSSTSAAAGYALDQMNMWLTAIHADKSNTTAAAKVRANRPADLKDACWDAAGNRVEQTSPDGTGTGTCSKLYPLHSDPRSVAGMPITHDILKCALKPLDPADYGTSLTPAQFTTLRSVFPTGVCDYTKPGQGQAKVSSTWVKY